MVVSYRFEDSLRKGLLYTVYNYRNRRLKREIGKRISVSEVNVHNFKNAFRYPLFFTDNHFLISKMQNASKKEMGKDTKSLINQ